MSLSLRFPQGLYGVTPEWDDTDKLLEAIAAAARGGMAALQWRRKTASPEAGLAQARQVIDACRQLQVVSIVNDDWRLAALINADGVHIGRDDGSLAEARLALGPEKIIGCSCYNQPALAVPALAAGVDYIAFGAMYPSRVKPDAVRATLEHIEQGRMLVESRKEQPRAAVVVIGGITADNAGPLIHAGADSIALISGLFESSNIQATAAQCKILFD
ncbi:thiamine phosphate synthase [Pollutimonas harenae]|uniref:Thiamine-phosphate synthase n=1 Tax=Pollutimonas harenae TaxID=657015 RepID=A0A853GPS5_9BURK|nr:thiamine phosphate synthase [Pollutimonas harenae]NYT84101.1 thiamine phosphate synthase [Pollutimonas harenae]TEA73475.1 thiamine phosphate synthase [Pollutimonas harenae]